MHRHLTPKRTAWVSGVVLAVDECRVLVRADRKDRRVHVFVSGSPGQRRGALTVVRTAFNVVHELHPDLTITAMVPVDVPGKPDAAIEYDVLLTAERQKIKQVPLPGAEKPLTVKTLLDGVGRESVRQPRKPSDRDGGNHFHAPVNQVVLNPDIHGDFAMEKSTRIDARAAQIGALAVDGSMAENTGNQRMQVNLEPATATQVATLLAELLTQLKGLEVPAGMRPKLDETKIIVEEAKDVATSPEPDKGKLKARWEKAKGWVTSALDVGLFVEGATEKVKDLVEKLGGLLG